MIDFTSPTPLVSALASLALMCVLAILLFILSLIRGPSSSKDKDGAFERVIASVRWLDRQLVHIFSWATGTRYRKKYVRLPVLMVYFLACVAGGVFLPWPYGMLSIGLGVFSIFIVFRHWSRDEDEAVANIAFEDKDIKISGTLGSEVLLAVAFLFVFTPVAFAQLQQHGVGFTLEPQAGPFTFLVYTLIETVKAGSIVDYYDLYAERIGLGTIGTPSEPTSLAKATILGYRLSLNLLVLAAIKRLLDVAKRRAEGADLRAVADALRSENGERQSSAIAVLRSFALQGRGNARDMLEQIAEPRQSDHLPILAQTRFQAADALLDYGTQRGGASALYAAADGYRALMRDGYDKQASPKKWRATAHNLGNTLVQLGQQIGDPERLREAAKIYQELNDIDASELSDVSQLNARIVQANVVADLAMMTGRRADLEMAATQYRDALAFAQPENHAAQIAMLQTNLGATLADLAEIDSDEGIIAEAIVAYRAALEGLSVESDRETWSMAQNNLGNALADLGFWTSDTMLLRDSLLAHEAALSARAKDAAPMLWAMTQTNLANALTRLGKIEADSVHLQAAVDHYTAAQTVYQREDFPRDWAWSEASLASVHIDLGHMTGDAQKFEQAVVLCDGAIGAYTSAQMPAKIAWAQGLKGNALVALGRFHDAKRAFEDALAWQSHENAGSDWVMSVNNFAACQYQLGETDAALATLNAALAIVPDEPRLTLTLNTLTAKTSGATAPDDVAPSSKRKLKVRILDVKQHAINEGQFIDSTTLDWTLEIDGSEYRYRVTREEYIEADGQGKGSGYRVIDLNDNNKLLYHTLWSEWMGQDRGPEFSAWIETEDWRIGEFDGQSVFWQIDMVETDLWMTSYWDVDTARTREHILRPDGFDIFVDT